MLESVVIFRLVAGTVTEVVIPFGLAEAGFFSGCPVVLDVASSRRPTRRRVLRTRSFMRACAFIILYIVHASSLYYIYINI